jgi:hypothetical protein
LALSGFRYDGVERHVSVLPRQPASGFRCFWSTGTGWGTFAFGQGGTPFRLRVLHGTLACRTLTAAVPRSRSVVTARVGDRALPSTGTRRDGALDVVFQDDVQMAEGQELVVT